jgi:hypothetical protein
LHQEAPDSCGWHSYHFAAVHVLDRQRAVELMQAVLHGG